MVRISDRIWDHVEKTDKVWKCRFCDHVFAKGIGAQIVKCHLAGVRGRGTKFCSYVPEHVKMEALREIDEGEKKRRIIMSTSPSSSSKVTVKVSPKNDGERMMEQEKKLQPRDAGVVERESDQEMIEAEFPAVMVKNGDSVCEICRHEYERRTPTKKRQCQWHLADIGGSGDTICTSMPDDDKIAILQEITESKRKKHKTVPGSSHTEDIPTMSIEDVAVQPLEAGWSGFTKALEDLPNEADHGVRDEEMDEVEESEDASVQDSREEDITGVPPGDLGQPTEKDHEQSGDIAKGNIAMDVKEAAHRIEEEAVEADEFSSSSAIIHEAKRYDVFLSFRREDTRNGFISHLREALCKNQISTFIDDNLNRGAGISPSILTAIEKSTISLIIFSENYAGSKSCLKELAKILQCRKLNHQIVIPVFYGVEPSHIKRQTGKFGLAFHKLKERLREGEMDLDDVRSHLEEAANLSGWSSHVTRPESKLVKSIVGNIDAIKLIDNDGVISRCELEALLRRLGAQPPSQEEVSMMLGEVDRDGDGCISVKALMSRIGSAGEPAGHEELREAFALFDTDHDGKITAEELHDVFTSFVDERCTLEECRRMIAEVDKNGDGFVCFEDFARMMELQR